MTKLEKISVKPKKKCSIDGCGGKYHAKGYCGKHYKVYKPKKECKEIGCKKPVGSLGLCSMHYSRMRSKDINVIKRIGTCSVEGCDRPKKSKGMCTIHYSRMRRNGTLNAQVIRDGRTNHPYYKIWTSIKERCKSKSCQKYKDYGGRGIKISDEWDNDFWMFVADMGIRPTKQHSIDRKDNDGNYCKENCRWATKAEQAQNRRTHKNVGIRKSGRKYQASIGVKNKDINLGTFNTIEEARAARKSAEKKYWNKNLKQ